MIHRIHESIPMSELPTWLQELWELDSALARRAEKHYLELIPTKQPKIIEDCGTCKYKSISKYVEPCYGCRDNEGYDHYKYFE